MPTGRLHDPDRGALGGDPSPRSRHRASPGRGDSRDLRADITSAAGSLSSFALRGARSSSVRPRSARRAGVVLAISVGLVGLVPAVGQADPAPTIAQVTDQVDALYLQMTAAVEDYDEATVLAGESRDRLETLRANLDRLQDDLDAASADAGALASAQYQSAGVDPTVAMLLSTGSGDFLTRVSQLDQVADRQAQTLDQLATAKSELATQELGVARESARLTSLTTTLSAARIEAAAKHQAAEDLLAELTEAERLRVAAEQAAREAAAQAAAEAARPQTPATTHDATTGSTSTGAGGSVTPPSVPASGRAKIAVDFAMAQIGDSYVYGAAGPNSWDCSGLTMGAWGAAGVGLPHSSRAQSGMGVPVASGDLQPGDLVFYYSPVSHVGIYIGDGQIVHASNPSKPVGIAPVFSMAYAGARRVG